jgi:G3E family GTPase
MPDSEKPLIYLILGAAGSGRREILADLIDAGLGSDAKVAVLLSEDEAASEFDAKLPQVSRWHWSAEDDRIVAELPAGATHVFFVTSGRASQVDQIEAFKAWLTPQGAELARAICVVNCQLAEKNPPLLAWYEACIHFSDVVLLNRREGVENKWISEFLAHFKKLFSPCIFETVKAGRVKNPALVLEPQARRMTHVFDEEQDWVVTNAEGEEIDEEDETAEDEELQAHIEIDPYFERRSEAGRRVKELPDIRQFL